MAEGKNVNAKHTPGPWHLHPYDRGAWEVTTHADYLHPGSLVIAARSDLSHRAAESTANARLIAAAPDLLAAAKQVLAATHVPDSEAELVLQLRAFLALRDAVAKAAPAAGRTNDRI